VYVLYDGTALKIGETIGAPHERMQRLATGTWRNLHLPSAGQ
jgi:hypothetical protein